MRDTRPKLKGSQLIVRMAPNWKLTKKK